MENINTIYMNLPEQIKGFVVHNKAEDFNTIVLNSRHSYYMNLKTYEHELEHIYYDDFNNPLSASQIESYRHH